MAGVVRPRHLFAPEVVQTSAMDCGPAALKCLLEGFGIPVSYGRLREACQTDVDGTSIDTLEDVARQLRLDAVQVMLPVDHLLLPEAEALPALVVVKLPSGFTHFIVLWRRHGPLGPGDGPRSGRRWMSGAEFLRDLYIHKSRVPSVDWYAWARSNAFLAPLRVKAETMLASSPSKRNPHDLKGSRSCEMNVKEGGKFVNRCETVRR